MNLKKLKTKVAMIMLGTSLGIIGTNANTINDDKKIEQSLEETKDFKVMANNTTKLNSKTVQKHNHKFKKINVIKTINKDKKTYTETQIKQCSCGKIIKIKTIKKCDFSSWKYNEKTKKDERVCKITGYKQTRKHKHNYSKLVKYNTNYEYKKCSCGKQKKFKHNLKKKKVKDGITYTCTNKKCDFTYKATMKNQKKINHKHIFSKLKKVTSKYEYWKCKVKGCLLRKKHNLKTIEINDQIILKCQNSNCTYKKVKHTHKYTLDKVDDQYEYWVCKKDNKAKTITHNLINVKNQDGSVTVKCSNEGCNYNYLISHNHDYSKLAGVDDNYEYWECLNDGYQITVAHNIIKTVDKLGNTILSCSNPSCTYHKEIAHQHEYTKLIRTDDNYEYWVCVVDNNEIKKAHNMVESIDQNGDTLRKCSNPSCDYQKTIHNHQTNVLAKVDDNYEYWKCPKDDYQITQAHNIIKTVDKSGNTILSCSNGGCTYHKEIAHQHEYTKLVRTDDSYEYWACPLDNSVIKKAHNIVESIDQNGDTLRKCSNPSCDYQKTIHNHQTNVLVKVDDNYEYWKCPKDDYQITKAHNIVKNIDKAGNTIITCSNEGCTYHKEIAHQHEYTKLVRTDDSYEYWACLLDNSEITKTHNIVESIDQNGDTLRKCSNPSCDYQKTIHNHQTNVLAKVDDNYEYWKCPKDDYQITKAHNIVKNIDKAGNTIITCSNEGCTYRKEIAHQHEYTTFVKYDNNYEYWACPYDQEQITKNHNLTSMENPNGSITYKCSTCDYEYTTHVHQYLTLSSYDDEYEHWTCECEEEELRSHNLVYDHFDLASFTENYRCTTCDYTKSVDHVNHEYQITRTDDNYEYLRCDVCNQDTSRLHSFPLIGDEDGCKVTYYCTNPGCGVAKETEQHFYKVTNTVRHNGLDPDRCYTDTYTCQNCGDSYDQDVPHSLQIKTENAFERVEMCKNCSYEKTTELIALDLSNDNKIMDIEEENNLNNSIVEDEIIIEEASLRMDKPLSLTRSLKR